MTDRRTPRVVFVIGPAGSGKSSVARRIAGSLRAVYLDKDTLATRFTGLLLRQSGADAHERDSSPFYRDEILPIEYETLLGACGDNLAIGNDVVLDAPFGRFYADTDYVARAAEVYAWGVVDPIVAHVHASGSTVLGRIVDRGEARDGWKIEHWDEFWVGADADACAWAGARHCTVDNSGTEPDLTALDALLGTDQPSR